MDFDLVTIQGVIRKTKSRRDLYVILNWLCQLREKHQITNIEYEEVRDHISERFKALGAK